MERIGWAFAIPIGVTLVTALTIFLISRLLLLFTDQFIATAVALGMAILVMVVAAFLARGTSSNRNSGSRATH